MQPAGADAAATACAVPAVPTASAAGVGLRGRSRFARLAQHAQMQEQLVRALGPREFTHTVGQLFALRQLHQLIQPGAAHFVDKLNWLAVIGDGREPRAGHACAVGPHHGQPFGAVVAVAQGLAVDDEGVFAQPRRALRQHLELRLVGRQHHRRNAAGPGTAEHRAAPTAAATGRVQLGHPARETLGEFGPQAHANLSPFARLDHVAAAHHQRPQRFAGELRHRAVGAENFGNFLRAGFHARAFVERVFAGQRSLKRTVHLRVPHPVHFGLSRRHHHRQSLNQRAHQQRPQRGFGGVGHALQHLLVDKFQSFG